MKTIDEILKDLSKIEKTKWHFERRNGIFDVKFDINFIAFYSSYNISDRISCAFGHNFIIGIKQDNYKIKEYLEDMFNCNLLIKNDTYYNTDLSEEQKLEYLMLYFT